MLKIKKINQFFSFLKILVPAIIVVYLTGFMNVCGPLGVSYSRRAPPDDELIRIFKENREDFELLVDMAFEDVRFALSDSDLSRITPDFVFNLNTKLKDVKSLADKANAYFSEERWNTYRKLLRKLNIENGLNIYKDTEEVKFYPVGRKVYIYSKKKLEPVYKSLDGLEKINLNSPKLIYRKLDEHWYIYYDPDISWF